MIKDITITGVKYELNATTKKYVERKIGSLGKYLPRHARKSASADVKIKQIDNPGGNKYEVEVIINVPDKKIIAKDSTMNVLAAVVKFVSIKTMCWLTLAEVAGFWRS